jgi:putative transposase
MITENEGQCVSPEFMMPEKFWEKVEPLLPEEKPKPKGGHPREPDREMMNGIYYLLRTGCQWKAIPRCLGAPSTIHDRFRQWREAGVFVRLWQEGLITFDQLKGLDWEWQAMDGAMTKAPLGGETTGRNPTDRSKRGVKRSLLTEGNGMPIGVAIDGANRHDMKLTERTLESIVVARPDPREKPQNMCMDKGYDYKDIRELLAQWGYTAHIKTRGEEKKEKETIPGYRARRWVVERTHSWMNRFRRLLIRWEKRSENYLGFLHLACAFITFHAAGVFG